MKRIILIGLLLVSWAGCPTILAKSKKAKSNVSERVVLYPSVDQNGDSLILSGKLCVPTDRKPKGIILFEHGTISADSEAPSNRAVSQTKYYVNDYVMVFPDYIGYGATRGRIHPYLNGELTARNSVDMVLYCQAILDSMALGIPSDSIYVVGYSQGGAAALWSFKLIEEEYAEQIHVKKCFIGGTPCDVASIYDEAIETKEAAVPAEIPLLVVGTSESYNLHLKLEDFLTPAMIKAYNKDIAPKKKTLMDLYFKMPNHKKTKWMTAAAMDKSQPETQRLYEGLLRSSLVHYDIHGEDTDSICPAWRPKAPLYVFHSTNDELVGFCNAVHLRRCLGDLPNITWDFGKHGIHIKAYFSFIPTVLKMLEEENSQAK